MVAKSLVNDVALTATVVGGDVPAVVVLLLLLHAATSPMHSHERGGHQAARFSETFMRLSP